MYQGVKEVSPVVLANARMLGILVLRLFALVLDYIVTHIDARLLVWRPRTAETERL